MSSQRPTYVARKRHTESGGGTSFWKIFFGVLLALVLAGGCVVGGCLFLFGTAAVNMSKAKQEQDAYRQKLVPTVVEFAFERDWSYVRGTVGNHGQKTVTYWKLAARYKDKAGTVIDTDYTNSTETLGPGQSKSFEIMHRLNPRFANVDVSIEEVRVVQ